MSRNVKVCSISLLLPSGATKLEENIERANSAVIEALNFQPDIICLPECYTILGSSENDIIRSIDIADEIVSMIGEYSKKGKCYIISTILEKEKDKIFNTAFIVNRNGKVIGKYRKTHLAAFESDIYHNTPGNDLPVFQTDFGIIAVMSCMDIFFPEVARVYGLKGAELVFWPTQTFGPTPTYLMTILRARAIDNQFYCVSSNFCRSPYIPGKEIGRACVVDFDGTIIADTGLSPGLANCTIDLGKKSLMNWDYVPDSEKLKQKYPTRRKLLYSSRHPELYGLISKE
jgi:predicted amidohydrolase